jgi:hypothetical protein
VYWLWLAVLVAGQALLLFCCPSTLLNAACPHAAVKVPVIITGFFLANLFVAGLATLLCAAFRENGIIQGGGLEIFQRLSPFSTGRADSSWSIVLGMLTTLVFFWVVWVVIVHNFTKSDDPDSLLKHSTRWLLRGSILELLIAVPSHIIVRRRGDCCAPVGTFWGSATGVSVMLLCFGPGVFFLFVERFERLKPKEKNPSTMP